MSLTQIHGALANTVMYYFIILAMWGLFRFIRKEGISSNYWGALAIGEILILSQGALGLYLWIGGARPERTLHFLYGIIGALVIPGLYLYTRGEERRQVMLVYGVSLLIAVALIIRATMTGG